MATNASENINADSSKTTESNQNEDNKATTPTRKQNQMCRSKSLSDLVESGNRWTLTTPTEDEEMTPMTIQAVNNESLLFPPPRPPSIVATPIHSNARKKHRAINSTSDIFVRKSSRSVSFRKDIENAEHDMIIGEDSDAKDGAYGHYLSTSSFEESPDRQQQRTIDPDQRTTDSNVNNDTPSSSKKLLQEDARNENFSALSIPELSTSTEQLKVAAVTYPSHRRRTSNISEISLSEDEHDEDTISRDSSRKILQLHSNRRLSLTMDMETGRSPGGDSMQFHRGQHAIRRVYSTDMMDAQSPRLRRRRALSYNMDQLRRGLFNNVEHLKSKTLALPAVRSAGDLKNYQNYQESNKDSGGNSNGDIERANADLERAEQEDQVSLPEKSRHEDAIMDRKRRIRYNVEQKSVRVLNDRQSRSSQKYSDEVQYRLSAITPVELRRRRYRDSLNSNPWAAQDAIGKNINLKNGTMSSGETHADGKCNQCLATVGNFLTELTIFIMSQGRTNYSVGLMNKFLYWTFRKNFAVVLLVAAATFYAGTAVFAFFIYLFGRSNPQCVHVNGVDFGETKAQYGDAFALSWTTFSTVGYGLVYPGTSATMETSKVKDCWVVTCLTTLEAFVGILFSGVWGAICFAKVTRVSSFAQVSFSDAIIIKYGTGVTGVSEDDEYEEASSDEDASNLLSVNSYKPSKLPCPIFEFRIANRLHRQRGGEIIDACINIVASMEESQATRTMNGAGMEPRIRRKGRRPKRSSSKKSRAFTKSVDDVFHFQNESDEDFMKEINIRQAQEAARDMIADYNFNAGKKERKPRISSPMRLSGLGEKSYRSSISLGRSSTNKRNSKPFPNQIFAKLNVESMEHPFFKRVWNVRHVLDHTSPLLKQEAKELIRINHGHWPEELNNAVAVRASIQFDQILVSFSGTSNVDANSVYSQKAYNFEDVCVGYAFCNMLFREKDGSIGVDHSLLNDVKEQSGGGGEELDLRDMESSTRNLRDIFIL